MPRLFALFALCWLLVSGPAAQEPAPTLEEEGFRAQDSHQGVTIAARPLPDAVDAELVFGKTAAPVRAGILPVELLILNHRDEPVRVEVELVKILAEDAQFEQIDPATAALVLYPLPGVKEPKVGDTGPRLPIPIPRGSKMPKDKDKEKREEAEAALRSRQLRVELVASGGRARGFLYFDLREAGGLDFARASVYLPEVDTTESGEELLFYEILLRPYAQP